MGSIFQKTVKKELQNKPDEHYEMPAALRRCSFLNWWYCNRQKTEKSYHSLKVYPIEEDNRAMLLACGDSGFYSLDALTGSLIWKHEFQRQQVSINSIILYEDNIIILTKTGTLQVLRPWSRGIMWEKEIESAGRFPPLAVGNALVVTTQRDESTHLSGKLQAFTLDSGKPIWQKDYNLISPPALCGDKLAVNLFNGCICGVSLSDGRALWEFNKTAARSKVLTAFSDNILYAGEQENLYGIGCNSGNTLWRFKCQNEIIPHMICQNGILYLMTRDGLIYGIEGATGNPVWKYKGPPVMASFEGYYISPVIYENNLVISRNDYFLVMSCDSGKLRHNTAFVNEHIITSPPSLPLPGYFFSTDGVDLLHIYDYRKMKISWRLELMKNESGISSLAHYGSNVYFLTIDGDIFCIDIIRLLEELGDFEGAGNLRRLLPATADRQVKPQPIMSAHERNTAGTQPDDAPLRSDWFSPEGEVMPERLRPLAEREPAEIESLSNKGPEDDMAGLFAGNRDKPRGSDNNEIPLKEGESEMNSPFGVDPGSLSPEMERSFTLMKKEIEEIQNLRLSLEGRMNTLIKNMETMERSFQKHQAMLEKNETHQMEMLRLFTVLSEKEWPQEDVYIKHLSHIFKYMQYFKQELDSIKVTIQERIGQ